MFYSRRQLLSNYSKFKKEDRNLINQELRIVEEKRDNEYPIFESKNGTFIYTSFIYCLFKELKELDELKFIRINTSFIEEAKILKIIEIYSQFLKDFSRADELYEELKLIDNRIDSGFLYKGSVILKE